MKKGPAEGKKERFRAGKNDVKPPGVNSDGRKRVPISSQPRKIAYCELT